jgi:hypothetical protein
MKNTALSLSLISEPDNSIPLSRKTIIGYDPEPVTSTSHAHN